MATRSSDPEPALTDPESAPDSLQPIGLAQALADPGVRADFATRVADAALRYLGLESTQTSDPEPPAYPTVPRQADR